MKRRKHIRPFPNNHDQIGLLGSLGLHVIMVIILLGTRAPHPPTVSTIEVTIEPPTAISNRPQIVSPSDQPAKPPPENTTRLSDKDSQAPVEQIRRGDGGGAPGPQNSQPQSNQPQAKQQESPKSSKADQPKPKQEAPAHEPKTKDTEAKPKTNEPKSPQNKSELHLKDLKLDDSTLALKFGNTPKNTASSSQSAEAAPQKSLSDYQAFSRPPGSGAAFFGSAGISDHLPNLPDGDITLLNAKANIYASFVRRVAVQVFTQLRSQGWENLSAMQIRQMSGFATVEAVLSMDGKFIRARLIESSGSDAFDQVLHTSASKGTGDPNPPPGAQAKDGLIHFIFKARSWSQIGMNRRSGAPVEQRWLLLATGLE
jgi:hypothetical protein